MSLTSFELRPDDPSIALLVIDQQYDFEPGGALAVGQGDEILEGISHLMKSFHHVVMSQDSHPPGHISFASSYPGKKPYDTLTLDDLEQKHFHSHFTKDVVRQYLKSLPQEKQVLWPDHCVTGTRGYDLDQRLPLERASLILRKGMRVDCDSYSAFKENDRTLTGLGGYLRERKIETLYLVGLAGDYCVNWSAKDGRDLGFNIIYDSLLTRFVNPSSKNHVLWELKSHGVLINGE